MKTILLLSLPPVSAVFAQVMPAPEALSSWMQVAMYCIFSASGVVGLLVGIKMLRAKSGLPQPLTIKGEARFATAEDITQVHGRIAREREEVNKQINQQAAQIQRLEDNLEESIESLRKEIKGDVLGVHNRINEVLAAVSEVRGRLAK